MSENVLKLLADKNPITIAALCKSYLFDELRKYLLNARHNTSIHSSTKIGANTQFGTSGEIIIRPHCRIRRNVILAPSGGRIEIGPDSLLNAFVMLLGHGSIQVGSSVLVGPHTTIAAANHTFREKDIPISQQPISKEGIEIQDDVWIGANCTILDGVSIGRGSVVAAGSVVTETVPDYSVVAGVPAEKVATRGD